MSLAAVTPLSKAERNSRIEGLLAGLVALRGVTTAALVDPDGFVTHARRNFELDTDALGAATQIVYSAAVRAAEQVAQGGTKFVLSENKDGIVMMAPLARGFVLVVVADASSMLGAVRFEIKSTVPELDQLFGA
jgi:predicted regulator of Ras-like GTPase activity (Roadblock/LC7/MglB family)